MISPHLGGRAEFLIWFISVSTTSGLPIERYRQLTFSTLGPPRAGNAPD